MIPKIIHQTCKTDEIPAHLQGYQKTVRDLHPGWEYHLWTDVRNEAFVRAEYPDFLDIFLRLPQNIMRADVIRYLLMYKLGGLYMDLDYEMLKPFDLLDQNIVLPWEFTNLGPGKDIIANAVFAATPGHPFFKMVIDDLKAHPPLAADADVLYTTGPGFLSRIFWEAKESGMKLYTPEPMWFSPRPPHTDRRYRAILKQGVSYGIHHCVGSWRPTTMSIQLWNLGSRIKWKIMALLGK